MCACTHMHAHPYTFIKPTNVSTEMESVDIIQNYLQQCVSFQFLVSTKVVIDTTIFFDKINSAYNF